MQIAALTAYIINLPLKREIKHASATRRDSANLLIRCRLADGAEGWGEGVPRSYVTGETPEGAIEQLAATPLGSLARDCENWDDVLALCDGFQPAAVRDDPRGCYGNALRCAVETSLLDAFGKRFGEPVSAALVRVPEAKDVLAPVDHVRYSGAITAESPRAEWISALKMRIYGFHQCKVKVAVAGADDVARLRRIRRVVGRRMDLRIDANEGWRADEVVSRLKSLLPFGITCAEQPVPHADVACLTEVRRQVPLPIMLDESFTGWHDAREAVRLGTCDLFNIRISKCGGLLNSLRLAAFARAHGIGYQLGCHPGETGLLSAAGRHWASSVRDIRYCEGSYDRHLLREQLTREDMTFGYGGRAPALRRPGLGVSINEQVLARLTATRREFSL